VFGVDFWDSSEVAKKINEQLEPLCWIILTQ